MDQVARLQSLLETVQANRGRPRSNGPAAPAAFASTPPMDEPDEAEFDVEIDDPPFAEEAVVTSMPTPIPAAPEPSTRRPEPSPLQRAFDQEINQPGEEVAPPRTRPQPVPAPVQARPQPVPAPPQPLPTPAVRPVSVPAQRSANDGPEEIPLRMPADPSRPIAQVVSPVPPLKDATFGELLRRSLALRPL